MSLNRETYQSNALFCFIIWSKVQYSTFYLYLDDVVWTRHASHVSWVRQHRWVIIIFSYLQELKLYAVYDHRLNVRLVVICSWLNTKKEMCLLWGTFLRLWLGSWHFLCLGTTNLKAVAIIYWLSIKTLFN